VKNSLCLCLSTINKLPLAKKIARHLIRKKIAACVNIVPKVISIYEWDDEICEDTEFLLLIKTLPANVKKLQREIKNLHPYEVPEFVVFKSAEVAPAYFNWAKKNTRFSR